MPTVPDQFVPQVGQSATNTPAVSAPGVQPMQNYAPQQIEQFGEAQQRAGLVAMKLGEHIQNQLDDANVKAAETKFIQASMDLLHGENGYLNKQGADALNDYDAASQAVIKAKQDVLDSLGNDVQKRMFNRVATAHLATFGAQMGSHRAQQRTQYTVAEAAGRADSMRAMAQNVDIGSREHEMYLTAGIEEVRKALAAKGFSADSEEVKKAERDYRTLLVGDDVNRLMTAGQYADAKTLLGEQSKAGNVDPDVANRLRATIEANVEKDEIIGKADSIFAPYKNKTLKATDLETMLKQVEGIKDPQQRQHVESLVKGQFSEQLNLQNMKYRDNLNDVVNYKYAHNGSLKGIDPVKWGMLDAKDRYELTKPEAQESDLNTWYAFITKPETLTVPNVLHAFQTGKLTKGDFKSFTERAMSMAKQDDYVQNATEINSRIDYFARNAGIKVDGSMNDEQKQTEAALKFRIQNDIYKLRQDNHGKATMEQVDKVIQDAVAKHTISTLRSAWNPLALFNKYSTQDRYAFQMPAGATHVVPGSDGKMHYTDGQNDLGVVE